MNSQDNNRKICYLKPTCGGFTEIEVLRTMHELAYGVAVKGEGASTKQLRELSRKFLETKGKK
jgi:hypothetical protein